MSKNTFTATAKPVFIAPDIHLKAKKHAQMTGVSLQEYINTVLYTALQKGL